MEENGRLWEKLQCPGHSSGTHRWTHYDCPTAGNETIITAVAIAIKAPEKIVAQLTSGKDDSFPVIRRQSDASPGTAGVTPLLSVISSGTREINEGYMPCLTFSALFVTACPTALTSCPAPAVVLQALRPMAALTSNRAVSTEAPI
jgi:hypothetical protein